MATLILTAVGSALGGPVGGALGALLGGTVDRAVLGGGGTREGPRLQQLAVQTSSYGTPVPRLFGTTRVAGTVIWSTDLIESRSTSHAGKGQPGVTSYSYAASFAVLLSARPIIEVRRIWADGNLLRGAAGDWKGSTGFRLHLGDEDQAADPLIASAVGLDRAPAHRGLAYAVFENLQLAAFGNRIPSLTFEVVADPGPVGVGAVAAALAPEVRGDATFPLGGFAATGGSVGAAVATLAEAGGAWLVPAADGFGLVLRDSPASDGVVADAGVAAGDRGGARRTLSVARLEGVPRTLAVGYYDPARDYQAGLQQARRPGAGEAERRVELPAVLDAGAAKTVAEAALARAEAARTTRTVAPGLAALAVPPGACVTVAGEAGGWRVAATLLEGWAPVLTLTPLAPAGPAAAASSGEAAAAPDLAVGRTLVEAVELPNLDDQPLAAPRLVVAATGTGAGWRRAALLVSLDDGASWQAAGGTAAPAVLGTLVTAPPAAPSTLFDLATSVEVALARPDLQLADADDDRLDAGANLAVLGDELVQFGRAEPLGGARWRLSRLWRGRRGTEGASGAQAPGDRFVLLEPDGWCALDLPLAAVGAHVRVMATGVGDADGPAEAAVLVTGRSVVPPAPAHLAAAPAPDGAVGLTWVRRARAGWRWVDGVDVALGEEAEAYRVTLGDAPAFEVAAPAATVPAAARAAGPLVIAVAQRGTDGLSDPATLTLPQEPLP